MTKHRIPEAAIQRFNELQNEEALMQRNLSEARSEQTGTAVPKLTYQMESFVVNPSNVGTGILSRMIETDDTVASAVQFKVLMILAKIGEYHHDDTEISEFVNGFLSRMKGPTWQEAMEAMLSATAYGFSVSEMVFGLDKQLRKVVARIATYHPSTIAFEVDEYGCITDEGIIQFILQTTQISNPNNSWQSVRYGYQVKNPFTTPTDRLLPYRVPFIYQYGLTRIPRKKVIHHANLPMLAFGSPYGKTAVRTAHLSWQLKNFFLKQMGIAGKRNATPTIWATAPHSVNRVKVTLPDGSEKEVPPAEALRLMMATRETDDALITGPENAGYKIEAIQDQANLDQFLNVVNNLNVWIFRCFLMPSLVMTDGSAGSRSLGDKHFQIVDRISESDALKFGQTIINDMIERVVIENFGEQENYGTFKQRPQSIEERERLGNMFSTLIASGVMKNHVEEDMAYMRSSLSLPKDMDKSFDVDPDSRPAPEDQDSERE